MVILISKPLPYSWNRDTVLIGVRHDLQNRGIEPMSLAAAKPELNAPHLLNVRQIEQG